MYIFWKLTRLPFHCRITHLRAFHTIQDNIYNSSVYFFSPHPVLIPEKLTLWRSVDHLYFNPESMINSIYKMMKSDLIKKIWLVFRNQIIGFWNAYLVHHQSFETSWHKISSFVSFQIVSDTFVHQMRIKTNHFIQSKKFVNFPWCDSSCSQKY